MAISNRGLGNGGGFIWLALSGLVILLDQYTKFIIEKSFKLGEYRPITNYVGFTLAHNRGAAFSFLSQASGWQKYFFLGIGIGASAFMIYLIRKHHRNRLFVFALALILGGAIGNVVDRIVHSYVIDFFLFHWGTWSFPAFNLADSGITAGAIILLLDEFLRVRKAG